MTNLVEIQNNQVVVSSRQVANNFHKNHRDVLKAIYNLLNSEGMRNFSQTPLFYESSYVNEQNGQSYPMYLMNRDGFSLLVMGFTGKRALEWKIKYIEAFNAMEKQLKEQSNQLPPVQPTINPQLTCTLAASDAIAMGQMFINTFHAEEGIAYAKAFDAVGKMKGMDFTPMMCLLPSPTKAVSYLNPTAIGKQLKKSAIAVNKILEEKGLQTKENGEWRLTDEGAKYGSEKPYTRNGHSGWQILWTDDIVPVLN